MVSPTLLPLVTIATSAQRVEGESTAAILWLVVLLVMVLFGGVAAMAIRRHFRSSNDEPITSTFNLESLRQMKNRGELTEEEFKKARDHLHRDVLRSATNPTPPQASDENTSSGHDPDQPA